MVPRQNQSSPNFDRGVFASIFLFLPLFAIGQAKTEFSPLAITDTIPARIQLVMEERLKKDKAYITYKEKKVSNYIRTIYDRRFDYLVDTFNKDYFMEGDVITDYLRSVTDNIYRANQQLHRETNIFCYRSEHTNAVSFGEGTVCLMLGLLERLETEDQIAFVICHELAHYFQDHAGISIARAAAANFDKDLEKKIDAITSDPYDRFTKLKMLFAELGFSMNHHRRGFEYEADSVGLTYYLRTEYDPNAPLRVMEILHKSDSSLYQDPIDLRSFFDFREYPFKATWAEYKKSTTWHAPTEDNDTTRTHPLALNRRSALQRQITSSRNATTKLDEGKSVDELRYFSALEIIHSDYHFKRYGRSLFRSIVFSKLYPDNYYVQAMIAKSLFQLHEAQKNHKLYNSLEQPDPRFPENYDRLLTFISKLRLNEIASLAYNYAITRPEKFYETEEGLNALWLCSNLSVSKVDPDKVSEDYERIFPNGRYKKIMKTNKSKIR